MKKIISIFLITVCITAMCGCSAEKAEDGTTKYIYYLDPTVSQLTPVAVDEELIEPDEDTDELIESYIRAFGNPPEDMDVVVGYSDNVTYMKHELHHQVLYLYFDSNYGEMKPVRKALCNAALVKTMTQIEGVSYISIYTGDQPLMDESGAVYGILSASDYISAIPDINAFRSTDMTLYFACEDGTALVKEKHKVMVNASTSIERAVVEELIRGPGTEGNKAVIAAGTRLINVSVNDGTCYLNFTETLNNPVEGVPDDITLYAIVNTMTELTSVRRVQIMINSSQEIMLRDTISLSEAFEKDSTYIKE